MTRGVPYDVTAVLRVGNGDIIKVNNVRKDKMGYVTNLVRHIRSFLRKYLVKGKLWGSYDITITFGPAELTVFGPSSFGTIAAALVSAWVELPVPGRTVISAALAEGEEDEKLERTGHEDVKVASFREVDSLDTFILSGEAAIGGDEEGVKRGAGCWTCSASSLGRHCSSSASRTCT